jgi:hypothetical protein
MHVIFIILLCFFFSAWQECYDSTTGYTYYWNVETNQVTWEMPPEYHAYMLAVKQWQQLQAHNGSLI